MTKDEEKAENDDWRYINDFHRKWNEARMKEQERTQSMRFTHEYAKAQSEHLEWICTLSDDELIEYRKKNKDTRLA